MFWRKKKIPNPEIEKFEAEIERRGLLLVDGTFHGDSVLIWKQDDFINFAKREGKTTIFKDYGFFGNEINYFYIVEGFMVRIFLERLVKEVK